MGKYRILSQVGREYQHEVGAESHERRIFLSLLETRLQQLLAKAKQFEASRTGGPQVASGIPSGAGRVRALVDFHNQQQINTTLGDNLNAEVIRIRQWISRQSASLTIDGKIIWPKSGRIVEYDTELARQEFTRVEVRGGLLLLKGKPLDTKFMATAFSGPGKAIYVMSREGHIHVSSHAVGYRHHSSLLAGADVASAGEIQVEQGRVLWLSNKSGHYRPNVLQLLEVLHELEEGGVPLNFRITAHRADGTRTNYGNVDEFMKANLFDDETYSQILDTYGQYVVASSS